VKKETVVEAVKRLGDGWARSNRLIGGHWVNLQETNRVQRPDLVDALIMRTRKRP